VVNVLTIIPLSCAIATKGDVLVRKQQILENHTLEAVMSMPEDIFHNSKVGVTTCIMIISAHIPHPKGKKTWLGYWREDGFIKTKGKGRIDLNDTWSSIKENWLNTYINRESSEKIKCN
jgi:type I restriction enzyme M protein